MTGETDLDVMLATLKISRRPGAYCFVAVGDDHGLEPSLVAATITEAEGTTVVVSVETARSRGWDTTFHAAWLTLEVHSSLEAVGLTAAVARALADRDIACNVLAGFHHDHLLVPLDRVDDALVCLESLRQSP